MATIRSYIFIDQLQPKTMCYLGTFARGFLPRTNMAALVIEVAPGLEIENIDRHRGEDRRREARACSWSSGNTAISNSIRTRPPSVKAAGEAILDHLGATERDAHEAGDPRLAAS